MPQKYGTHGFFVLIRRKEKDQSIGLKLRTAFSRQAGLKEAS